MKAWLAASFTWARCRRCQGYYPARRLSYRNRCPLCVAGGER